MASVVPRAAGATPGATAQVRPASPSTDAPASPTRYGSSRSRPTRPTSPASTASTPPVRRRRSRPLGHRGREHEPAALRLRHRGRVRRRAAATPGSTTSRSSHRLYGTGATRSSSRASTRLSGSPAAVHSTDVITTRTTQGKTCPTGDSIHSAGRPMQHHLHVRPGQDGRDVRHVLGAATTRPGQIRIRPSPTGRSTTTRTTASLTTTRGRRASTRPR